MVLVGSIRLLLFAILSVKGFSLNTAKANAICDKIAIDSYSKIDKLVGKRWKIYYAWNLNDNLVDNCMEIMFKNATPMVRVLRHLILECLSSYSFYQE